MKISFTKTTILLLCLVLGLTIGISSAFGQKLAEKSHIKGEVPIHKPNDVPKKDLVPEHLKPKKQESNKIDTPQVKGEKPIDTPKNSLGQKRLAPENSQSKTENTSQQEDQTKPEQEKEQNKPTVEEPTQEKPKPEQEQKESSSQQKEVNEPSPKEQQHHEQPRTEQTESNQSEDQEKASTEEDQEQQTNVEQSETKTQVEKKSDPTQNEVEIPEMKVENSKGETIDVTSVIEDIFGDVNSSKEDMKQIQKQMKKNDVVAQNQVEKLPPKEQEQISAEVDENNLPRTIKHGKMPMTASNDLQGVLIGLVIAAIGVFIVLFRKGEST